MKALSVPNIVMSAVCVTITLYELAAWLRSRGRRQDLAFIALAFGGALYNFACAGEYGVFLPVQSEPWMRMQAATLNLTALAFAWYFFERTGRIGRRTLGLIALALGLFALAQILPLGSLTWIASRPAIIHIALPFGIRFSYLEVDAGPLTLAAYFFGFGLLVYLWWIALGYRASGARREARPLLGMLAIVSLAYANDFAVGNGYYSFIYTVEYAWLVVVVLVGQRHSREIMDAALAKRALQESERRLIALLQEKDLLLKEVHHRVKNNLQIVSSLLFLQGRRAEDPRFRELLQDCRNQVASMALIHEDLYRSKDLMSVDFGTYAHTLVSRLLGLYREEGGVSLSFEAESLRIGIDQAIPLGLILNELCTNTLKHAFPPERVGDPPTIFVTLRRSGPKRVALVVADNGIGVPEDFDPAETASFGMKIVHKLADQLGAELCIGSESGPGARFELEFPAAGPSGDPAAGAA
ncbi:MAG TPA: sensor histidine kinase [Rectinemataceae bacterium]|nr:sensor histidine kinase [Rectinemataceae bacterium]